MGKHSKQNSSYQLRLPRVTANTDLMKQLVNELPNDLEGATVEVLATGVVASTEITIFNMVAFLRKKNAGKIYVHGGPPDIRKNVDQVLSEYYGVDNEF